MSLSGVALPCLVFLLSLTNSFASKAKSLQLQPCTYIVRTKTGDRTTAGTDSKISLKLKAYAGDGLTVPNLESWGLMGPGHDYFERGNLDIFSGSSFCLSQSPCAISITSNGEGFAPGWYLDYVEVTMIGLGKPSKISFPTNQWLALDESPNHLYADVNLCDHKP